MLQKQKYTLTFLYLLLSIQSLALNLSGKVLDNETHTGIPFANVFFTDLNSGASCDENGTFYFTGNLPQNTKIKVSAIGYETQIYVLKTNETEITINLIPSHIELEEFVISTNGELQRNSIVNVEHRSIGELQTITNNDLGAAISNIPSVYNNSTGNGISKPMIRGLSGMRIVTYLNGLRIENQQWGGDHGLGVTDNGIGSIEVIKGPASLLYGADALGGVLYLIEEPFADQNSLETMFSSKYEINSRKYSNNVGFKLSGNKLKINLFGTQTNAGDFTIPTGEFVKNSRYQQQDIKTSLGYHQKNWIITARYNYVHYRTGIPGHTHDSVFNRQDFLSESFSRAKNVPAQVVFSHFSLIENAFYFKRSVLKIKTGFTSNRLQEFEEKFTQSSLDMTLNNYTYNVYWEKSINNKINLIIGSQCMNQTIQNARNAEEKIIPNAHIGDLGAYLLFQGNIAKWNYQMGGRFDQRVLETSSTEFLNLNKKYLSWNYSLGVSRMVQKIKIRANISSGYRPPHSSEMLINGIHHGTYRYEIGDIELKSEQALQMDLGLDYSGEHLSIGFNPYVNLIKDYIYIKPIDSIAQNYPVYEYTQDPSSLLLGGDLSFHYHPHFIHQLHIEHNTSFIYGIKSDHSSFPLIPQPRLNTLLKYQFNSSKKLSLDYIAIQHLYFFNQNKIDQFETVSYAYHLINISLNAKVNSKNPFTVQCGIRNLLNNNFTDHLSRLKPFDIPAPGRNFFVSIKFNIKSSIKNE
ncbi:MAG: TonB-dependent receptor [Flavobacteriales bacterium]|nr:TonB-dependent receptor [Flavobacteriales bacterium]